MRVLDLFSGTGGWSEAFLQAGHDVVRIDNDPKFVNVRNTAIADVIHYSYGGQHFDVVLASPPCQKFSVARISDNWYGSKTEPLRPKSQGAAEAMKLVKDTLDIVQYVNPKYWWMENPVGAMRRLEILQDIPRRSITFCKYGKHYRKPTDLWGNWPDTWQPPDPCTGHPRNGIVMLLSKGGKTYVFDADGNPCHESASRGSKTGIQGLKDATERGAIPFQLSQEVLQACIDAGL